MHLYHSDNPYKTLGIDRNATEEEIKQAYFDKVREHSPEHDPEGFKRIRAAYEKLRFAGERMETDLFMVDEQEAEFDHSALQLPDDGPLTPGTDQIKKDLISLEAFLLLEELKEARRT